MYCRAAIGSFGASLGGFIAEKYGVDVAFLSDIVSFLCVATLVSLIPSEYNSSSRASNHITWEDKNEESLREMTSITVKYLKNEPKVLCFCLIKACGALVWGAVDVIQVKFCSLSTIQVYHDLSITLGIVYSVLGLGSQVGPLLFNCLTPQIERNLMNRILWCFACIFMSYFIMAFFASNIAVLLIAVFIRAVGSSTLWTYSSLLLQITATSEMKGRIFAIENSLYCLLGIISIGFCGVLFDYGKLDAYEASVVMLAIGLLAFFLWLGVYSYLYYNPAGTSRSSHRDVVYSALALTETSFGLDVSDDELSGEEN